MEMVMKVYQKQLRVILKELDVYPVAMILSMITTLVIEAGVVMMAFIRCRSLRRGIFAAVIMLMLLTSFWRVISKNSEEKAFSDGNYQLRAYTVKSGDTLWDISVAHYKDFGLRDVRDYLCELRDINPGLTDWSILKAGDVIYIPVPID
jgi:high-affinity Fe2+/Pb2+ permease